MGPIVGNLDHGAQKRAEVRTDQFKWLDQDLIHRPTGAIFAADSHAITWGEAGRPLANGEFFDPVDIAFLAGQMLLP